MLTDNLQAIFDAAASHLMRQGRPAIYRYYPDGSVSCRYRADDGTKCAIGALIPDFLYTRDIEGLPALDALARIGLIPADEAEAAETPRAKLLVALQAAHDASDRDAPEYVIPAWKARLRRIAASFDLDTSGVAL